MSRSLKEDIWEIAQTCGVCGSENYEELFVLHEKAYVKCLVCQVPRLYERIALQNLNLLYGAYYRPQQELSTAELEEQLSNPTFAFRQRRLEKYVSKSQRDILEVGCGDGNFLAYLRRFGWQVDGTEYSEETVKLIRTRHNIETRLGDFASLEIEPKSLSVLGAYNVLEHIYEPQRLISAFRSSLKPQGTLHLQMPNYHCVDRYLTGNSWGLWSFPEHVYFYSPSIIKDILGREGFKVLSIKTYDPWHSPGCVHASFRTLFKRMLLGEESCLNELNRLLDCCQNGQQSPVQSKFYNQIGRKQQVSQLLDKVVHPMAVAFSIVESWFGYGNMLDVIAKTHE